MYQNTIPQEDDPHLQLQIEITIEVHLQIRLDAVME